MNIPFRTKIHPPLLRYSWENWTFVSSRTGLSAVFWGTLSFSIQSLWWSSIFTVTNWRCCSSVVMSCNPKDGDSMFHTDAGIYQSGYMHHNPEEQSSSGLWELQISHSESGLHLSASSQCVVNMRQETRLSDKRLLRIYFDNNKMLLIFITLARLTSSSCFVLH